MFNDLWPKNLIHTKGCIVEWSDLSKCSWAPPPHLMNQKHRNTLESHYKLFSFDDIQPVTLPEINLNIDKPVMFPTPCIVHHSGIHPPPPNWFQRVDQSTKISVIDHKTEQVIHDIHRIRDIEFLSKQPYLKRAEFFSLQDFTFELSLNSLLRNVINRPTFVQKWEFPRTEFVRMHWENLKMQNTSGSYPYSLAAFYMKMPGLNHEKYLLLSTAHSYVDWQLGISGTSSWYYLDQGSKFFFVVPFDFQHIQKWFEWNKSKKSNQARVQSFHRYINTHGYVFKLVSGQTLMIPSGYIYASYSPEKTVGFCGRYLTLCGKCLRISMLCFRLESQNFLSVDGTIHEMPDLLVQEMSQQLQRIDINNKKHLQRIAFVAVAAMSWQMETTTTHFRLFSKKQVSNLVVKAFRILEKQKFPLGAKDWECFDKFYNFI